ncbi:MAG: RnfABCDGE type electron transport complex subunit G [Anaeromicrobium sp.]|jgi:electron transport complex protein RnfG|uniref:RnfABCDGE type electron transport complex subunit G n=1 Tax=Anaeromicrobium sp. TaxID=1929132 RepID=UPI0025D335F2|nr:RnfABCDGE type electron transport complex subunit G [Anaeromicrobium sp.]MCT4594938.1 RnfABCDGE type electron transport complex subunit G [Anaeromicrobium sp.]
MREITKLGIILFAIAAIAASILAYTYDVTKGPIEEQLVQANIEARQIVLPDAQDFEEVSSDKYSGYENVLEVYAGKKDGEVIGYTIKTLPQSGYGGAIEVMIGISNDSTISGVNIGTHQETPGLGAKASGEFKDQYNQKSTDKEIKVIKSGEPKDNEVLSISGATITSSAVTDGVNLAIKIYNEQLK